MRATGRDVKRERERDKVRMREREYMLPWHVMPITQLKSN